MSCNKANNFIFTLSHQFFIFACRYTGLSSTITALKESMSARFKGYEDNYNAVIATYLDPRYKMSLFSEVEYEDDETSKLSQSNISEELARVYQKNLKKKEDALLSSGESTEGEDNSCDKKETDEDDNFESITFEKYMDELLSTSVREGSSGKTRQKKKSSSSDKLSVTEIKLEMKMYENQTNLPRNDDPFMWWNENKDKYPHLSTLAKKYLSSPPSSVESERVFSIGGNVNTPKRNRLLPEMSESLIFLHYNLRILNYMY